MSRTLLLLCLLAPLLMSCATTGQSNPAIADCQPETKVIAQTKIVDTSCDWAEPIFVSKADVLSDATAKAILAYDKAGAAKCGWKPSSK